MPREMKSLSERVEWLAEEVLLLKENLGSLASRLEAFEKGEAQVVTPLRPLESGDEARVDREAPAAPPLAHEESWAQVGQEVLLPRVAAVSFMLVAALILRTVTDNGMLNMTVGSFAGMTYAMGLIGTGFWLYRGKSRLAPVFPACGVLLLYSIIFETHHHFSSLSSLTVYMILLAAEIIIVLIGLRCKAKVLLFLAVFGSTFVGAALDFPEPNLVLFALIILVNCVGAHFAARSGITSNLRWYTLLFACGHWILWAYKLNFALKLQPDQAGALGLYLSLPLLFVFWAFYTYTSLWKTLNEASSLGAFHHVLPSIVAGGTFFAANSILSPWQGRPEMIGVITVAISASYMALVAWLAKREVGDAPGGKEFVTAATILLIQGLSFSIPAIWAMPIWGVAAMVLTVRSSRWRSGGIRVISYLFQIFILVFAYQTGSLRPSAGLWPAGLLVTGIMAGASLWLYRWCRRNPPDYDSVFFSLFDKKDVSAVSLLLQGLFYCFCMARFAAFAVLRPVAAEVSSAFLCTQSIIVNIGIVALLILGLRRRNREILTVAGLVVLVAAFKVFIFDLFKTSGLPLVLSVFSFGVVAAVSSIVMRKWQNLSVKVKT